MTGDYASFLRINIGGDAGSEFIVTMSTLNTMQISRIFTLIDPGVYVENFKTMSENLIETHRKYFKKYADICKEERLPACSALQGNGILEQASFGIVFH